MLDDNLNRRKLAEMIGAARFNTPTEFKDFLKEKIKENFLIDHKRLTEKKAADTNRFDFYILDEMTKREVLVVMGLKTVADTPQITQDDIQKFHTACKTAGSIYGVLMTEAEVYFFEYKKEGPVEINDLQPLNYTEAEFERKLTPQKLKDYVIAHKYWAIGISLIVILMISSSLANAKICKTSGPIKAEIKSSGEKVYYLPESPGYSGRITGDQPGERRYCDERDAIGDGFVLTK